MKRDEAVARALHRRSRLEELLELTHTVQRAVLVDAIPNAAAYHYELKYDGYRFFAVKAGDEVRLISRRGQDWTGRLGPVARAVRGLAGDEAVLDGEVCAVGPDGVPSFQLLQRGLATPERIALVYVAFDVLNVDGEDVRSLPLESRRERLRLLLDATKDAHARKTITFSEAADGTPNDILNALCGRGFEGLIAKRKGSPYRPGSKDWLKLKCHLRQELAILGYIPYAPHPEGVGALLLGAYENGAFTFAGKVGTGFDLATRRDLARRLDAVRVKEPVVRGAPRTKGAIWCRPALVAEITFGEWTDDGRVRHGSFVGLRMDKTPEQCVRERPVPVTAEDAGSARPTSLLRYREKRDFTQTPEPSGSVAPRGERARRFVIQKHAASHLHYDFRLELSGVLKSWAVPKGPSLDASVRRLASETEDHPLAYADFEGVIPKGQYGGGTVLLWDHGTWEPEGEPHKAYHGGKLRFRLHGAKLHGLWTLTRDRASGDASTVKSSRRVWRLHKEPDEEARPESEGAIVELRPESVATGRSLEEIAHDADREWHSNRGGHAGGERAPKASGEADVVARASALPAARKARLPRSLRPPEAKAALHPPSGDDWLHEIEVEGQRALAFVEDDGVHLRSDHGEDLTAAFPNVVRRLGQVLPSGTVVDGAVTMLRSDGTPDPAGLDDARRSGTTDKAVYFVFDAPSLAGYDLRRVALDLRKGCLEGVLRGGSGAVRYVPHVRSSGAEVAAHAAALGVLGIVSKRAESLYEAGPKGAWVRWPTGAPRKTTKSEKAPSEAPREKAPKVTTPKKVASSARPKPRAKASASAKSSRSGERVVVAGVSLSHPERVLFPEAAATKLDLAHYYEDIADVMLPHVVGRPLTLVRCPEGVTGECLYMRHSKAWGPSPLKRVRIVEKTKIGEYLVVEDGAGLVALAQMNVLEIHTWSSTADDVERPNRLVLDLDPDESIPWDAVVEGAFAVRKALEDVGLASWVKTTGGKGVHVVAPLVPTAPWGPCLAFARAVCARLAEGAPTRWTLSMAKAKRKGKIFLDYLRNNRTNTAVAAFSTRARPRAPVSVPITWSELEGGVRSDAFTLSNVRERLAALRDDPWKGYFDARQKLTAKRLASVGVTP